MAQAYFRDTLWNRFSISYNCIYQYGLIYFEFVNELFLFLEETDCIVSVTHNDSREELNLF